MHRKPGATTPERTAERDRLALLEPILGVARDVHDTHKHGPLTRRSAQIIPGERARAKVLGFYGRGFFERHFLGGGVMLEVRLQDGTTHPVKMVLNTCLAFWDRELQQLGL